MSGTLYKHLDNCITASGKRLLRKWICHPLKSTEEINKRLDVVETLVKQSVQMSTIMQYLRRLPDLERLLGQVKSSVGSCGTLLLPLLGVKVLKQRVCLLLDILHGCCSSLDFLCLLHIVLFNPLL